MAKHRSVVAHYVWNDVNNPVSETVNKVLHKNDTVEVCIHRSIFACLAVEAVHHAGVKWGNSHPSLFFVYALDTGVGALRVCVVPLWFFDNADWLRDELSLWHRGSNQDHNKYYFDHSYCRW